MDPNKRSPRAATGRRTGSAEEPAASPSEKPVDWWRREQRTSSLVKPSSETGQTLEAAADLVDKAKETARATAKAVSSQAAELAGNIGSELSETAEEQKSRGADAMRGFAKAVQGAANELDGQSPAVARYVRSAAESVEGLSETIRSRSVKDLVTTASDTARTHPAAFFIGAVAAGFALSRFFKSTSRSSTPGGGVVPGSESGSDRAQSPGSFGAAHDGAGGFGVRS
jgi:hypothetical protein